MLADLGLSSKNLLQADPPASAEVSMIDGKPQPWTVMPVGMGLSSKNLLQADPPASAEVSIIDGAMPYTRKGHGRGYDHGHITHHLCTTRKDAQMEASA